MLKLTLSNENGEYVITDRVYTDHSLEDILPLIEDLLLAAGYRWDDKLALNFMELDGEENE